MLLKRIYRKDETGALVLDERKQPIVAGIRVLRLGRKQKFSPDLVTRGAADGWLVLAGGRITLKAEGGDIAFRVVRTPGTWCCHCGAAAHNGAAAREHIAAEHAGKVSPDPENPSGYMVTHAFKGVREGKGS